MSHPYIQINGKAWTEMLIRMQETVVAIVLNDSLEATTPCDVDAIGAEYARIVNNNKEDLFRATTQMIVAYINFYQVHPNEGIYDEFKSIYFIGMAMSAKLINDGHNDLNKLHLRAVLRLLDIRLEVPHKAFRPQLSDRIKKAIKNDTISKHYGDYGWYLIYKCLFNAANERSNTV